MNRISETGRASGAPAFLALACVGFVATAPALAHGDPTGLAGDAEQDSRDTRQDRSDIVVQGERDQELVGPKAVAAVVNTPRSITVIPDEVIRESGSATLEEVLRTVPGITFGAAEGGNPVGDRPFLRGFDTQGSTYVDGLRDIGAQSREVFAIEQVEVVKGSDSTLGGRGNAGGAINLVTKLPQRAAFVGASASYGFDDYKRVTLDVNQPLSSNIGVRISAMYHDQDVAGRDALFQTRWGVQPSVTIGLDGPTQLTAYYYHLSTDELPDSGIPYLYGRSFPAGVTIDAPAESFTTANGRTGTVSPDSFYGLVNRDFRETEVDQGTVFLSHDFGGVTLRNALRYGHTRQSYIYTQPDDSQGNVYATGQVWRRANTRDGVTESWIDQLDLYGTVDTGGVRHSFSVGLEASWEKSARGSFAVLTSPRCTPEGVARYNCTDVFAPNPYDPWVNYASETSTAVAPITATPEDQRTRASVDTLSLYAYDSITLASSLILNLGLRWDDYSTTAGTDTVDDSFVNVQAGLVFKPSEETSLYASYATSSVPPGSLIGEGSDGNGVGGGRGSTLNSLDDLQSENTKSYEVGAKAALFDGALALNAAVFRTETDNARVTDANGVVAYIGTRRVNGFEFGANGTILPGWTVFGGYSYLDAIVTDGGTTRTTVGGVSIDAPSVTTGKRFPNTPEHSATLWTTLDVTPQFSVGGGAFYQSQVNGGYTDSRTIQGGQLVISDEVTRAVPGYVRLDATAAYQLSPNVALRLNVQNLTDKRYYDKAYAAHYASIAPGRSAYATLSVRF